MAALLFSIAQTASLRGDAFFDYSLVESFALPAGSTGLQALPDGRLLTLVGAGVVVEGSAGTRQFETLGTLPGADVGPYGAAFVRLSPDGTRLAVGNGGGAGFDQYRVGVFDVATLSGTWFQAEHFDAAWADDTRLALTAGTFGQPSVVDLLDITSPDPANPVTIRTVQGIGGASGGIAFDSAGNLYTANGYATAGPSGTGAVRRFDHDAWLAALNGAGALEFESSGSLIVDVLSGGSLGFDDEGHLFVGGSDFFGGGEFGFAALVHASAVADAAGGGGAADILNGSVVRRLDPDGLDPANFYSVSYNRYAGELYVRDGAQVYTYVVPEPASWVVLAAAGGGLLLRRRTTRGQRLECGAAEPASGTPGGTR